MNVVRHHNVAADNPGGVDLPGFAQQLMHHRIGQNPFPAFCAHGEKNDYRCVEMFNRWQVNGVPAPVRFHPGPITKAIRQLNSIRDGRPCVVPLISGTRRARPSRLTLRTPSPEAWRYGRRTRTNCSARLLPSFRAPCSACNRDRILHPDFRD